MNTSFKKILLAFFFVLIGAVIIIPFLPNTEPSFTTQQELNNVVKQMNAKLPRKVGSIGQIDKVSLTNNIFTYHYSIYGNSSVAKFYEENFNEIRDVLLFVLPLMNGQNDMGIAFAKLLSENRLSIQFEIKIPNGELFHFKYEGSELFDFISTLQITPTEALLKVVDAHIKLTNLSLPITINNIENEYRSIYTNTLNQSISSGNKLLKIVREENNVISIIETDETEFTLNQIKEVDKDSLFIDNFAMSLSEDADFREFMSMLAIAHSNFTYRFRNQEANDSADIFIPYSFLKKHCSLPTLLK